MPKLTYKCPICDKQLVLAKEFILAGTRLFEYKCGHIFSRDVTKVSLDQLDFTSVDGSGKKARQYQQEGVQFIIESDFNMTLGDQMRLGKTPQALLALKNAYKERTPCLIIVRPANLWQWIREYKVWCDSLPNGIFPILGTKAWIPQGFSAYIISMDTFGSQGSCKCKHRFHEGACKGKDCSCRVFQSDGQSIIDQLKKIPFRLIIADEAHSFKNTDSNRSQALVEFVNFLNSGEIDLSVNFTCTRCKWEWIELGKQKFDKRIGHQIISKSTRCPKCSNYCYVQQLHSDAEKNALKPEAATKIQKLIALGNDQSTTDHERQLALQKAKEIQETEKVPIDKPCGLVLLTGTAIKNRAEEYFVPLNLINPEKFSSLERFRRQWLEQDTKGRWSRIKHGYMDAFKEEIKPYVLRREKEDVFTDLPALNRTFTVIEPDKDAVSNQFKKLYNDLIGKMEDKLADKINPSYWDMAEDLMELRRICGMMKTPWVSDYLEASLLDSDRQLYAVGLHHESVRETLFHKLGGSENCWKFSGKETRDQKNYIETHYTKMRQRVGLLNMLAGGVGCDFHEIDNVIILERQWSSADEEQFEFRFYNPDLAIKNRSTNIEYVLIKGSIEEFFFEMVEEKRRIFGETISNHWSLEQDNGSFKDLLQRTLGSRL